MDIYRLVYTIFRRCALNSLFLLQFILRGGIASDSWIVFPIFSRVYDIFLTGKNIQNLRKNHLLPCHDMVHIIQVIEFADLRQPFQISILFPTNSI